MSIDRAIYIAASGASEAQNAQALHANNIANSNTAGFKAQYETQRALPVYKSGLPTRVYSATYSPGNDYSGGSIIDAESNLNVYFKDQGFFAVQGEGQVEGYTRRGDFTIDQDGQLINGDGYPVIGASGIIVLPPFENVNISDTGEIFVKLANSTSEEMVFVNQLKLVNPDVKALVKSSDTLFRLQDSSIADNDENIRIASRGYENSNVNAVNELLSMIDRTRNLEMDLTLIHKVEENAQSASRLLSI